MATYVVAANVANGSRARLATPGEGRPLCAGIQAGSDVGLDELLERPLGELVNELRVISDAERVGPLGHLGEDNIGQRLRCDLLGVHLDVRTEHHASG